MKSFCMMEYEVSRADEWSRTSKSMDKHSVLAFCRVHLRSTVSFRWLIDLAVVAPEKKEQWAFFLGFKTWKTEVRRFWKEMAGWVGSSVKRSVFLVAAIDFCIIFYLSNNLLKVIMLARLIRKRLKKQHRKERKCQRLIVLAQNHDIMEKIKETQK